MVDKNNYKHHLRFFFACVFCILGVIGGIGSLNYGASNGWLYSVAGVVSIAAVVYVIVKEYKRFESNT